MGLQCARLCSKHLTRVPLQKPASYPLSRWHYYCNGHHFVETYSLPRLWEGYSMVISMMLAMWDITSPFSNEQTG